MRTHIWIRKENEQRWEDIADKSSWINEQLKKIGYPSLTTENNKLKEALIRVKADEGVAPPEEEEKPIKNGEFQLCKKHGNVLGFCKYGCK